jgi:hypothetical protein
MGDAILLPFFLLYVNVFQDLVLVVALLDALVMEGVLVVV